MGNLGLSLRGRVRYTRTCCRRPPAPARLPGPRGTAAEVVMRVPLFLQQQQVPFETIIHAPAFTAQKRAKYLRVSGRQVVKAVLLAGPEDYLVAVLPATHHVDTVALAARLCGSVRLAEPQELARLFQDCEFGVVPPFGGLY